MKDNKTLYKVGKVTIIVLFWAIILSIIFNYRYIGEYKTPSFPYTGTSITMEKLQPLFQERVDYVTKNSGILDPYDKKKLDIVSQLYKTNTDMRKNIAATIMLLPNSSIGFYPIYPISDPNTITFRFNQGTIGWHFLYGTYYDINTKNNVTYFCYIAHLDIIPPDMMAKYNMNEGEGSYYSIAIGCGINGQWEKSPWILTRGTFEALSISTFSFTGLDLSNGDSIVWRSLLNGQFELITTFTSTNTKKCIINTKMDAIRPPFLDAPGGCMPCASGAGTLYSSYTQMSVSGNVSIDSTTTSFTNAIGWVDNQWLSLQINEIPLKILSNIAQSSKGLARYMWLNLHVNNNLQYMINVHPTPGSNTYTVLKGNKYTTECNTIRYPESNIPEYGVSTSVTVLDTVLVGKTEFPTKYLISIEGVEYTLDSTPFGSTVTYDITGNDHWDGSSLLYDYKGDLIGTGFLEASQLQQDSEYNNNKYIVSGIDVTSSASQTTISTLQAKMPFSQILPSYIVLILFILAIIISIVIGYKIIKGRL
jgi:hypothetical protein